MFRRSIRLFIVLVFALGFLAVTRPASAAGITFNQFNAVGCGNSATSFKWTITGTGGAPYNVRTIVWQGSKVYMDEIVPNLIGDITWNWSLYNANQGGTQNSFFPLSPNTFTNVSLSAAGATINFNFVCSGTPVAGPAVPSGFVLRTVTCNTPVYDTAGGRPLVTGEAVTAGQTWFVNPKPVVVGKSSWTEIFNSGVSDGFIPTSCVGGAPAGF